MNTAIILSGGTGERMKSDCPKQYLQIHGKEIVSYTLETFAACGNIDRIVIVADSAYFDFFQQQIKILGIRQDISFALPGISRQHSVLNALNLLAENGANADDIVLVHDAVRPLVSSEIINRAVDACKTHDGAMPVVTVKDTVYQSADGKTIDKLLKRSELFAGQSPESFHFGKFYQIHTEMTDEQIGKVTGCSILAREKGLNVLLIEGAESNFKITTIEDLKLFELLTVKN